MNELAVVNKDGIFIVDSRDVAEMIEKEHSNLMRDIRNYSQVLENSNLNSQDFFILSAYKVEGNNKTYECYLLTKKGCDMVANKMTGEKGVLFTAVYVTKFEEMENSIKRNQLDISQLSPDLQMFNKIFTSLAQAQLDQKKLNDEVNSVKESFSQVKTLLADREDNWRDWLKRLFNETATKQGGTSQVFQNLRNESYDLLEKRAKCDLSARQRNERKRLEDAGATKTKINGVTKLDVIEEDARLKEIYTSVIKEISIKYVS